MKRLVIILFPLLLLGKTDFTLPKTDYVNGSSTLIEFHNTTNQHAKKLYIGTKSFLFFPHPYKKSYSYILLPIDYNTPLGAYDVFFEYSEGNQTVKRFISKINVIRGNYKKEELHVNGKRVTLSKKDQKRASKEYTQAYKIYHTYTKKFQINQKITPPINSKITSPFGNERLFNGKRKSFHSGVDFRAKMGTPVFSIGRGTVVLNKKRFYAGGSLIIDHGEGIYSCYYHLSKCTLKVGDSVKRHSFMARSGKSGRVTGPHLHLSVKVQGVTVNPLQTFKELDKLLN